MSSTSPIFQRRAEAGLTQTDLAHKAGVAHEVIRRLENGGPIERVTPERVRVAHVLGCSVADLSEPATTPDAVDAIAPLFDIDPVELREGTTDRARFVKEQLRLLSEAAKQYEGQDVTLVIDREQLAQVGRSDD